MKNRTTVFQKAEKQELSLRYKRRGRVKEWFIEKFILLNATLAIVAIILIFVFVGKEALPVFTSPEVQKEANLGEFFLPQKYSPDSSPNIIWQPVSQRPKYSVIPLIIGTLKATIVAMLFAIPLAVAAAIFTSEFAPNRLKEIIKPVIELLAGIPSVVLGFFALIVMASFLQSVFDFTFRLNAINAGIALGLAVIPIIYTVSEDSLNAVPKQYREASLALGATRWQTAIKVALPAALPGIFAGIVLGFGRAVGETMIVLMASGNAAIVSWNFGESIRTLSATIAAELGEVVFGSPHYHALFFLGALLFVVTFIINFSGALYVEKLKAKLTGAKR
ncbi:MAG: phosphate ABC transporter permease subunit PstC [candidate division Zixibacteria bacterium]|nr:phosphate ABC transporter permease subunit PstC [candidate division Zixibacteria bacterium]